MEIKDFNGKHIGFRVIKADRRGKAKVLLVSVDCQSEIEVSDALLVHNGICPDCRMPLKSGTGSNGEPYTACDKCNYFSE